MSDTPESKPLKAEIGSYADYGDFLSYDDVLNIPTAAPLTPPPPPVTEEVTPRSIPFKDEIMYMGEKLPLLLVGGVFTIVKNDDIVKTKSKPVAYTSYKFSYGVTEPGTQNFKLKNIKTPGAEE